MPEKNDDLYGYGQTDEVDSGGGKYLNFRKGDKGRTIQIRLVSQPRYVNQHWITDSKGKSSPVICTGEDCPYCGNDIPKKEKLKKVAQWGWIVIDREDGGVKIFTGPTLIARKIRKLVENSKWGNPFLYDIEITRQESPGEGYYDVLPVPDGKGEEITKEEKEAVAEADYNLAEELESSRESENTGNYGANELETAPDDLGDVAEDEVSDVEDVSDDIPF